jgi:hypothetical protein
LLFLTGSLAGLLSDNGLKDKPKCKDVPDTEN